MFKKFHTSLKLKLLVSTLSVTFLLSLVSAFVLHKNFKYEEESKVAALKSEVEQLSNAIGTQFYERYGDVQAFAENAVLWDQSPENRANIQIKFNEYIRLYGIYSSIVYTSVDGSVVATNTKGLNQKDLKTLSLPKSFAEASWFKNAIAGRFTEDKSKGFTGTFVEEPQIDPISTAMYDTDMYGNSFSAVVKNNEGKAIGVITNRADFTWVESEVLATFKRVQAEGFGDMHVALANGMSQLIVDHLGGDNIQRDFKRLLSSGEAVKGYLDDLKAIQSLPSQKGRYLDFESGKENIGIYEAVNGAKFIESLGWQITIDHPSDIVFAESFRKEKELLLVLLILAATFTVLSWLFANRISKIFMQIGDRLRASAETSHKTAQKLTKASQSVSDSSTDQSAAVQETVSSMSEITSMIAQTNSNVKECTQIASRVSNRSEQGNQTMRKLVTAMDAVNHANSQLQNMANIINEVSAKTMVINDIVFKTQLLSINASIEAARAGQHGKGFAVVAEEVGNLAQMSGNAAKEIQLLISDSQKQVLQIIEVTQSRSKESQSVSQEAVQAFSEIASGIISINERLGGVMQATHEQEIGIQQISVAMTQMDQSTQRNSSLAAEANELASDISRQSEMSFKIVKALRTIVMGSQANKPAKSNNLVDSLIDDQQGRGNEVYDGGQSSTIANESEGSLVSLMNRFEGKLKAVPQTSDPTHDGHDIDGDDATFKKPA